jgi:Fe-S oxidoreductase
MWMEKKAGKRINIERVEQALRKYPKTVAVCCPYCLTMFEDGLKDKGMAKSVNVLDVAEVAARALAQTDTVPSR